MRRAVPLAVAAVLLLAGSPRDAGAATAPPDPVAQTLSAFTTSGAYPADELAQWQRDWTAARSAARRLSGSARTNLAGVVANTTSLAKRGLLGARARPAFLTVRTNLSWFAEQRRAAPANATRAGFGTDLVWQLYSGSGWQLQPLATFGKLNALDNRRGSRAAQQVRALADQLVPLGVPRGGFVAFEYLFPWDGAEPGWMSGMAQATGMQALAGAGRKLADPSLVQLASQMMGAFTTPPPVGVARTMAPGRVHYLQYSQSPDLLIGNAFAQALLGLDHYREITGDARVAPVLAAGLAEAHASFPLYDTGAWSLYYRTATRAGTDSDVHYHELFADFLGQMCVRFGDPVYCTLQAHFAGYEKTPVPIQALGAALRGRTLTVRFSVPVHAPVTVRVWAGQSVLRSASRALRRGPERFSFKLPASARPDRVTVDAVSPTGVRGQAQVPLGATASPPA